MNRTHVLLAAAMTLAFAAPVAHAQAGRDACVEKLRETGGPDAQNGVEVLDTHWSQAGTLVTMRTRAGRYGNASATTMAPQRFRRSSMRRTTAAARWR
jgi:hypothetical protein